MNSQPIPNHDVRTEMPADLRADETLFPPRQNRASAQWNPWPSENGTRVAEAIVRIAHRKLAELNAANAVERLA